MKTAPQSGILNRPPDHVLLASYTLVPATAAEARAAIDRLREVMRKELRSTLDPTSRDSPKDQPSAETGELGFSDHYDRYHLTLTLALAATAFDKLGTPPTDRPQDLRPIPWGDQIGRAHV